jgi:hypothetical protein
MGVATVQARRAGAGVQALLLLTMWAATCVGALVGETHALVLEQRALDRPSFASLGVDEMLAVASQSVSLSAKPGERLDTSVSSVANISGSLVPLSLSLDGPDGLAASVTSGSLGPGQTATVWLSGKAPKRVGQYNGTIHLYGFNKYLHVAIAVRLTVSGCDDATGSVATPAAIPEAPVVLEGPEATATSEPDTGGCDKGAGGSAPLTTLAPAPATPGTDATVPALPTPFTDTTVPAPPTPVTEATPLTPPTPGTELTTLGPPSSGTEITSSLTPSTEVSAPPATPEVGAKPPGSAIPGTTTSPPTPTAPSASPGAQPAPDPTPEVVPAPVIAH